MILSPTMWSTSGRRPGGRHRLLPEGAVEDCGRVITHNRRHLDGFMPSRHEALGTEAVGSGGARGQPVTTCRRWTSTSRSGRLIVRHRGSGLGQELADRVGAGCDGGW